MRMSKAVENSLRDNEATRSSDKLLTIEVWDIFGLHLSEAQRAVFLKLPTTETIRRTRQAIQAKGKYPASEKVRNRRKIKGQEIQQAIPKTKPKNVDKLIDNRLFDIPIKRKFV